MSRTRVVIAGTHSGVGKTTAALGVMSALKERGLVVQPFKVGPDYIDPGHHTAICERPSRNLDSWMTSRDAMLWTYARASSDADVSIVEGVMGLFDGYDGLTEAGSTAEVAKLIDAPVVLVVDARSMARTVGAIVLGFEKFDTDLDLAGLIFNNVSSDRHFEFLHDAVESSCQARVFGYLPRDEAFSIPERHLGLVMAQENSLDAATLQTLTDVVKRYIDIDGILEAASSRGAVPQTAFTLPPAIKGNPRIAVARDEAFCFYYQDNLDMLQELGAELISFSPLSDERLPEADGVYLGGGYPEVFVKELAVNESMKEEVRNFAESGGVIYAECGGLMYLSQGICDFDQNFHDMVGILPHKTRMLKKRCALGYTEVEIVRDCIIGKKGMRIRGHEFHYSEPTELLSDVETAYLVRKRSDDAGRREGYVCGKVLASYVHLPFLSNPLCAQALVQACVGRVATNSIG